VDDEFKPPYDLRVRAVRGGQCGSHDPSTTTSISTSTTTAGPNTTTTVNGGPCPLKLIYGEDSYETELLRYFRDNTLSQTSEGQELIKLYYQWSPAIVKAIEEDEEFKAQVKEMIDVVLPLIGKEIE
jgi:hypothetical protein